MVATSFQRPSMTYRNIRLPAEMHSRKRSPRRLASASARANCSSAPGWSHCIPSMPLLPRALWARSISSWRSAISSGAAEQGAGLVGAVVLQAHQAHVDQGPALDLGQRQLLGDAKRDLQ